MFTTGSKWFLGLGLFALVLAAVYGWTTGGELLGPLSMGYKGGVGDHLGYTLLTATGLTSLFLGLVSIATRDADPDALAAVAGAEEPPATVPPAHPAYWPVVGAFGAALVVLGLVISSVVFVIGLVVLGAVLIEWMVLAWSDHATGDPAANKAIRDRLMSPLETPLAGFLIVGGVVIALSRLMLTTSKLGAVGAATALGVVILAVAAALAAKPRVSRNVVAGVLSVSALAVVALGVVSAARGERTIEHHEPHLEEGEERTAYFPEGTNTEAVTEATVPNEDRVGEG